MTIDDLNAIEERLMHGGVWSQREIQMKSDIAELLAEVRRLGLRLKEANRAAKLARDSLDSVYADIQRLSPDEPT